MNTASLYPRLIETRMAEALADTPVVLLAGPRQVGKTTLVRQQALAMGMRYLTLDDDLTLLSARQDPTGMVRSLDLAVIDEIQRAPQLLLAIKKSVDEDRRAGRFLLTGSANLMTLPAVADSLAGRMETLSLLPLSQSELHGNAANWIDAAFAGQVLTASTVMVGDTLVETVLRGGYPEALSRSTERRRTAWARQYTDALIQRDVLDVAGIDKLAELPRFLRCLAQVSGQMCNYSQLGAQVGLDSKTAARYTGVFEQMYLLKRVDVWARNRLKRVIKTPKLQFLDAGLLATLAELGFAEAHHNRARFGHVLETFVYSELLKHTTTAEGDYRLLYYRDLDQVEVDVVIENAAGQLVGVEVKAAATVDERDLRGLKKLASAAGDQFKMGILLYDGTETLPLGDGLWAAPLSTLWGQTSPLGRQGR
ncbi:ATP-binding protein [Rhodoferax fermentans]|uniref:AAA family ATPase n=1 Tax=Rhodoferax fermentans TaxID=28066 RepID=A0A1T1AS95_RHOFE|nr:ATP-binding protein [Rhodoferax fermentans]MBK1684099.1 AAA family ATPase [Rhodoferax fermentans]OOV06981.1 AAA family ATPase [Rhodoferax fermentans]